LIDSQGLSDASCPRLTASVPNYTTPTCCQHVGSTTKGHRRPTTYRCCAPGEEP